MAEAKWEFPMDPSEINKDLAKKSKGLDESLKGLDKIAQGEAKMNKIVMDIVAKRAQRKAIMDKVRREEGKQNFTLEGESYGRALGAPSYPLGTPAYTPGTFGGGSGGGGGDKGGGLMGELGGQARMLAKAFALLSAVVAPTAAALAVMSSIQGGANATRKDAYQDVGKLNMRANYWSSATGMDRNSLIGMVSSSTDPAGVTQVLDAAARMRMTGVANLTPQKLNMLVTAVNNGMPASEAVTMLQQGTTFRAARVQAPTGGDRTYQRSEQMKNTVQRTAGEEIFNNQLPEVQRAIAMDMSWEEAKASHPEWANIPGMETMYKVNQGSTNRPLQRNIKRLQSTDDIGVKLPELTTPEGPATPVRQPSINTTNGGRGNMRDMAAAAVEAVRNQKQVGVRTGNRPAGD